MKIEILTKNRENEYNDFILKNKYSMFNSSLKFRDLIIWLTGAKPYYFLAIENDKIIGVLPAFIKEGKYGKVINSMPWFGSNPGIIINEKGFYKGEIGNRLLNTFWYFANNNCISSTYITHPMNNFLYSFNNAIIDQRIGCITYLPEENDSLMKIYDNKTRNMIRKAQKSNILFKKTSNYKDISWLYYQHKINMKKVNGPIKSLSFFNYFRDILSFGKDWKLYIAQKDEKNVAGLLLKYFNNTVDYITPVIDINYRTYQPLSLLIFEAMKEAIQENYKYWNWGGTTIPGQEGVLHFKKSFGGIKKPYYYFINIYNTSINNISKKEILKEYPFFYVRKF